MPGKGWKQLLAGAPWFQRPGAFPVEAYSEFVPPPRLGPKPYGTTGIDPRPERDLFGWNITEYEEAFELRPGLEMLAHRAVGGRSSSSAKATPATASRAASCTRIPTGLKSWRRPPAG